MSDQSHGIDEGIYLRTPGEIGFYSTPVTPPWPAVIQAAGCQNYTVEFLSEVAFDEAAGEDGAGAAGFFDPAGLRILVRTSFHGRQVPHQKLREVLVHEWLHSLFSNIYIENEAEESIVLALTPAIIDSLRGNAALVNYIVGGNF
jgi:hypothetical protein